MSKFVLLFVVICVLASVCYAEETKRVRRDVAEETQKALDSAQAALKDFFTEDTWNKVVDSAKELGSNLKRVADDVVQKVSEKTATPAPSA